MNLPSVKRGERHLTQSATISLAQERGGGMAVSAVQLLRDAMSEVDVEATFTSEAIDVLHERAVAAARSRERGPTEDDAAVVRRNVAELMNDLQQRTGEGPAGRTEVL